eukprot:scaffold222_cov175-Amphora_coffeaeformis.AAC.16
MLSSCACVASKKVLSFFDQVAQCPLSSGPGLPPYSYWTHPAKVLPENDPTLKHVQLVVPSVGNA